MADIVVRLPEESTGQGLSFYRPGSAETDGAYQRVVPVAPRLLTNLGMATSFRILGNAGLTQTLLTIENIAGSSILIGVRRLSYSFYSSSAYLLLPPLIKVSRSTAVPSGGTTLTKLQRDTANTASSSAIVRGANASDGGGATAITATAAAALSAAFVPSYLTLVGQSFTPLIPLLEQDYQADPIVLRASEGLMVHLITPTNTTGNPATFQYICTVDWEEWTPL